MIKGNGKRLTPPSAFWSGSTGEQMASEFFMGILMGNLIGILPRKQMAYLILIRGNGKRLTPPSAFWS